MKVWPKLMVRRDVMRVHGVVVTVGLLLMSMHTQASLSGAQQALPLRNGRPAVALVNRATISLEEFLRERGPTANRARLLQGRGDAEDLALLDRLISIKLIAQEAATMGLDEVPELQKQIEVSSREILREVLIERLTKHITPDAVAVEKLFRESVREWKTTSLLFQSEEAASRARKEIAGGATFAGVASRAVAAKTAQSDSDAEFHPKKDYLPQIAVALATMQVGEVSPVIRLQNGFVVVRVADVRHPANAEARAEAKKQVLSRQHLEFLKAHEQVMRRQFVVVNKAVVSSLNYEATQPSIEALLKDTRVVASIKGAASVTVGDLTDYLRLQYFHGSEQPSQRRRMNQKKEEALDATLGRRLLNMEALKLGIDKTHAYLDRITGFKESLVFDSFVQKVIAPENKMTQEEVRQYYNGHLKEYSSPGMVRARSLAFARRGAGEDAMRKLREGADYNWLAANAEGRVAKGVPGVLTLDGQPVMTDTMPDGLQKALAGARAGEFKLYASPEGHFYVLAVQQVIGATPRPFDDVKDEIAKKLYGEKLKKAVETYAGKLRAQSKVETYLARMK